ncbi:MAG: hypothetical protein IKN01_04240 [Prevotella sp.]|nr:hypothetical protein [Prevotella sp.]
MKNLLLCFAALLVSLSINAQVSSEGWVSLLKVNYEGTAPNYMPTGDNPLIVETTPEGLALTNPSPWDHRIWKSMMVLTDDCLSFQKKHNYVVRLTVKIPHKSTNKDKGAYKVQIGSWENYIENEVLVRGGDDFQVIDVDFPEFAKNVGGDGHVVIKTQWVNGTTLLKEVEVFENTLGDSKPESPLIFEKDWSGVPYIVYDAPEGIWVSTEEGLAISNPQKQEVCYHPQTCIAGGFLLEQNHDYVVRLTLKVPSDGIYQIIMGTINTNFVCQIPVPASDDFQVIDVLFTAFAGESDVVDGLEECSVFLQTGWVVGTTVVKSIEIYEIYESKTKETAITTAHVAQKSEKTIYNLAGQKVNTSYKGLVIKNGKKYNN